MQDNNDNRPRLSFKTLTGIFIIKKLFQRARNTVTRTALLEGMWKGASARVLTMPSSALFAFLTAHLVIVEFGPSAYSQYGLLVSILSLLPFLDLGLGTAVVNALSRSRNPTTDEHALSVIARVLMLLGCVSLLLVISGLLIHSLGLWQVLLGNTMTENGFDRAATVCWLAFSLSLPVGIGSRVLLGLGKNHVNIMCQATQPPLTCLMIWSISTLTSGAHWPPILFFLSLLTANLLTLAFAVRRLGRHVVRDIVKKIRLRRDPSVAVMNTAVPMLVIMIAAPLALQSDRIVLSHLAAPSIVAEYNLASQLFSPVWSVIATISVSLWPVFTRRRTEGTLVKGLVFGAACGVGAAAALGAGIIVSVASWLARLISNDSIVLDASTLLAFAVFIVVQAIQFPLGYSLMDSRGLRFQAIWSIPLVLVSLILSILSVPLLGAAGPVYASAIAIFLCQILPEVILILQRKDLNATRKQSKSNVSSIRGDGLLGVRTERPTSLDGSVRKR